MFGLKISKKRKNRQNYPDKQIRKSGLFDTQWYLDKNPDVKRAKMNPIYHYVNHGWKEGRNPSVRFDTNAYLSENHDVAAANICPLIHYINYGKGEGRTIRTVPGKTIKPKRTLKQKIKYTWEYPVRVYDECHRLKDEIKKIKSGK